MTLPANQNMDSSVKPVSLSSWPAALASVIFSAATFCMTGLYSNVHWYIMRDHGRLREPELLQQVYPLLNMLGWLRVFFALCAILWAVWSLKGRPRWLAILALPVAVSAGLCSIIMT